MSQGIHGHQPPEATDGRNINLSLGVLSGEAAEQNIGSTSGDQHPKTFTRQPGPTPGDPTYYGHPVIKKSPWGWDIPAYYYCGGAAGSAMVLGAAATLFNRQGLPRIVRGSRWIAVAGASLSAFFLIHDLGRPERFHHMLRVFRPTSPMSVGTYIVSAFSSFSALALLADLLPTPFRALGDISAVLGGILGLAMSGYTGVLVSHTVVPIWQRPHKILPVLFLGSAAASAASLFDLIGGNEREHRAVSIYAISGKLTELAMAVTLEREVATVPEVARPLNEGFSGALWNAGKAFSAASLLLSIVPNSSKTVRRTAGILGTMGALCIRFGIHYAGQRSAMSPRATFHQQRAGQGAFEVTGTAALVAPDRRAFTEPQHRA